jgi:hypothetical protein
MKIYSRQFSRLVYPNKDNNKIGKSKRLSEENSLVDSFSQTIFQLSQQDSNGGRSREQSKHRRY